jgi:hypothetical protein
MNATFAAECVDSPFGEPQSPVAHPSGRVPPLKSSRHSSVKVPFAYEEYCTQLMYWWSGNIAGLKFPPNVESPGQTLK